MLPKKALFIVLAVTLMVVKQPVSISIQDQQVDLSDPNASVNITLSADSPTVPIVITYDDGSTRYLGYTFNYVAPPTPQPADQTCDYEEEASSCPYGGLQTCTGAWQEGVCKYDGSVEPNCRNIRCNEPSSPPPPEPEPPPPASQPSGPSECEDVYYCDNGTTIHKYGYHDGNTCQYVWDDIGEPC